MSTFILKLIAIITMLIDHVGAIFISPYSHPELYILFRGIGRLAFPIFVFLIVEGSYHTKDIMKYMKRLAIFALISEIPFDIAFYRIHNGSNLLIDIKDIFSNGFDIKLLLELFGRFNESQNVFFTLFLGLAMIYLMKKVEVEFHNRLIISNLLDAILTIVFCFAAAILNTDYDMAGILLFVAFYLFRSNKIMMSICLFIITGTLLSNIQRYLETRNVLTIISMLATFSMIPIAFYNGKKGKNVKYIFYIFYPAHLLILFLISQFISL